MRTVKRVIFLLAAVLLLSACGGGDGGTDESGGGENGVSPAGSYWKAVEFTGGYASDEFWADLFLWENGSGYFRVSQATVESGYWGMRDVFGCDWSLDDGNLLLTQTGAMPAFACEGVFEQERLIVAYSGFLGDDSFKIIMEQAELPPYGAQWELPELYGKWVMASYADMDSGAHVLDRPGGSAASEIAVYPTFSADLWLKSGGVMETESEMGIILKEGPIWEGCKNEAWHAELVGASNPSQRFYISFADGVLLLKKTDENDPGAWPFSFTAEYGYAGDCYEYSPAGETSFGDGSAVETSLGLEYDSLLELYSELKRYGEDSGWAADTISESIAVSFNINDEQKLSELRNSLFEAHNFGDGALCYAIHDINGDGVPELLMCSEDYHDINAIYTLNGGRPVLLGAYWSRNYCAVGMDGTIYVSGSSGASDSASASFRLPPGGAALQPFEAPESAYPAYPENPILDAGLVFIPLE